MPPGPHQMPPRPYAAAPEEIARIRSAARARVRDYAQRYKERTMSEEAAQNQPAAPGELGIVPPHFPPQAAEFAKAVGDLAKQYGIRQVALDIRVDTGYGTPYWDEVPRRDVVERIKILVSHKDGRGRPRTQITLMADINVRVPIVNEPNSSN